MTHEYEELCARLVSEKYAKRSFPICARDAMLKAADHIDALEAELREWQTCLPPSPSANPKGR